MKRVAIVGGETHVGEITQLAGRSLQIVGSVASEGRRAEPGADFDAPVYPDAAALYAGARPEVVAIANENDRRAEAVLDALDHGCDVIVDKPLAVTAAEQARVEQALAAAPERRLLMLLTLRAHPLWAGMRREVRSGRVGAPAFCHVRMAVRLKRDQRPPWFLDWRRSGGLFLDLLIHGLDQVEWVTGRAITAVTAVTGNLSDPADRLLRDHASVFCELAGGGSALVEGQRLLPDSKASDYRMLVAGTQGYADLSMASNLLTVTDPSGADAPVSDLPDASSVVSDWLSGGERVDQASSLRANRLALLATRSAELNERIVDESID